MSKILITGSSDGLGQLTAKMLIEMGHEVVLHARNKERGADAKRILPNSAKVLIADLASIDETKKLAEDANSYGHFDAVVHNAGLYQVSPNTRSFDGFPMLLAVNILAPYILTSLMAKPKRLIYLSSGMHLQGDPSLLQLQKIDPKISYSDSKLHDLILSKAVARKWKNVYSNAVDPGWVPTKMGGPGATDSLVKGYETQVWLADGSDNSSNVTATYFHHKKKDRYLQDADNPEIQEKLLQYCEKFTGIKFPE